MQKGIFKLSSQTSLRPFLISLSVALGALILLLALNIVGLAAGDGPLVVSLYAPNGDPLNAYNLVVDSNVSSPSTYGPSVATIIARFCNAGTEDLTNVWGYIGSYGTGPGDSTPGDYPTVDSASFASAHPLYDSGIYAFSHLGGSIGAEDARRYIGTIPAGGCRVQYWHFTYPQCSEPDRSPPCTETPVWGDSVKPEDDLSLSFDVWGTADGGLSDDATWTMTMRNEISAMANKIEPNPSGRWFNSNENVIYPGDVITSNGVLYRFGNANKGFDNNNDFVYDYNAWAQPIGDITYDPSCFRLIRTTGVLTVSRSAGKPDMVIDITDKLYFMNLPPDNTDVIGEIRYVFQALAGPCASAMTPYQEVASGADNEKFNGDFGAGLPPVASYEPDVTIDKGGNITVTPGSPVIYTIDLHNEGTRSAGLPLYSMPLMIEDTLPSSTTLETEIDAPGFEVLYSTDNGATYTTTFPSGQVTNVQLWMNDELAAGASAGVTMTATVDNGFASPVIENCANVSFGIAADFAEDCTSTLVEGTNTIGDYVWRDENLNGQQDDGATGISDITVSLYWDKDDDGELDDDDQLLKTTVSDSNGAYEFNGLPNTSYLVIVDETDADLPAGYRHTTDTLYATTLDGSDDRDADFGFGPSLSLDKTLLSGGGYEGQTIDYILTVKNLRPGTGEATANGGCSYEVWAGSGQTASPPKNFTDDANAYGAAGPDGAYAYGDFSIGANRWIEGTSYDTGFSSGSIITVEAVFPAYLSTTLGNDQVRVTLYTGTTVLQDHLFPATLLNNYVGISNAGWLAWDVSQDAPGGSWDWSDFDSLVLRFAPEKSGGSDDGDVFLDAFGFRIVSSDPCPAVGVNDVMSTVPLTDTYDAAHLEYVSAHPDATAVDGDAGTLSWDNVGPIFPGESKDVRVQFLVKELTGAQDIVNTAGSTETTFRDSGLANNDYAGATGRITPTGEITGVIWSDVNNNGWQGVAGYDSGDLRIPKVRLTLFKCRSSEDGSTIYPASNANSNCVGQDGNKGEWVAVAETTTDSLGNYEFVGLRQAYYYVAVDTDTLLAGFTATAEPDSDPATAGRTCGDTTVCTNTWWKADANLRDFTPLQGTTPITQVNFGYTGNAVVYGTIWEDADGDGTQESGEGGLDNGTAGITVTLDSGTSISTTQTDADGNYAFAGLVTGTYTITVDTGTLPAGTWTQTDDPDGTCVPTPDASCDDQHTVTVSDGEVSGSHDFGYHVTGSSFIGDTVFNDWDGDGVQDNTPGTLIEGGIPNITVTLYEDEDGDGAIDAGTDAAIIATTTSITGYYSFEDLAADTYVVVVDLDDPDMPDLVTQTGDPDETGGVCDQCDSHGSADTTGGSIDTVDFGYQPSGAGTIGDTVFRDMDGDGTQAGPRETGIADIKVTLEADLDGDGTYEVSVTTTTDADGSYLFTDLPDGAYRISVDTADTDLPTDAFGYAYVPSTATGVTTSITAGSSYLDADFGFTPLGAIGDTIYWDANANGQQDWNETGIGSGIVITVTNTSIVTVTENGVPTQKPIGTYVITTTTASDGTYKVTGLPSGSYTLTVGITNTLTLTGDPDTNGTSCTSLQPGDLLYPYCDNKMDITLKPGTVFLGADFGYQPSGVIGDFVWRDTDGDGVQDATEPGIAGVVITATKGTDTFTTTTDFDGYYTFQDLEDGVWTIIPSVPQDMAPTGSVSSEVISGTGSVGITGGTYPVEAEVTVTTGAVKKINDSDCTDCDLHVDFGFVLDGAHSVSGHIFFDAGGDGGAYGVGDAGYEDVLVYLWDSAGAVAAVTSTTGTDGAFTFTDVPAGTYTVSFSPNVPRFDGMSVTASPNGMHSYNQIVVGANVTGQDFGLYAEIDYGDLPSAYGMTLSTDEGAGHITGTLTLGSQIDTESDGQETDDASGDDETGADDDDGIQLGMTDWRAGGAATITATISGNGGFLVGYADWNGDGDFGDAGERLFADAVPSGDRVYEINIPDTGYGGVIFARFRLYDTTEMGYYAPTGLTTNGEVEDYAWPALAPTAVRIAGVTGRGALAWIGMTAAGLVLLTLLGRRRRS